MHSYHVKHLIQAAAVTVSYLCNLVMITSELWDRENLLKLRQTDRQTAFHNECLNSDDCMYVCTISTHSQYIRMWLYSNHYVEIMIMCGIDIELSAIIIKVKGFCTTNH